MNLTDLLSSSVISSIAGQTGTSEKDTQNVLANALPALVGAMAQNASTEDGANSLAKALDDHTSSKGLASLLQNVDTEDGTKILTKILGGETETVQNAVAKKSGASKVDTSKKTVCVVSGGNVYLENGPHRWRQKDYVVIAPDRQGTEAIWNQVKAKNLS